MKLFATGTTAPSEKLIYNGAGPEKWNHPKPGILVCVMCCCIRLLTPSCASLPLSVAIRLPVYASVSTRCHQNMSMGQWQAFYSTRLPLIAKAHWAALLG